MILNLFYSARIDRPPQVRKLENNAQPWYKPRKELPPVSIHLAQISLKLFQLAKSSEIFIFYKYVSSVTWPYSFLKFRFNLVQIRKKIQTDARHKLVKEKVKEDNDTERVNPAKRPRIELRRTSSPDSESNRPRKRVSTFSFKF